MEEEPETLVNPLTKRKIKIGGPTYKKLVQQGIISAATGRPVATEVQKAKTKITKVVKKKEEKKEKFPALPANLAEEFEIVGRKSELFYLVREKKKKKETYLLRIFDSMEPHVLKTVDLLIRTANSAPPSVVALKKLYMYQCSTYVVMEDYEKDLYEQPALKIKKKIVEWMYQLLCALDYFHGNYIILGELTPDTIFISTQQTPMIASFSQASIIPIQNIPYEKERIERAISVERRAPELLVASSGVDSKDTWNEKVDIWSIGLVFYEMIQKRRLFKGTSAEEVIDEIGAYLPFLQTGKAEKVEIWKGMDKEIVHFLQRCFTIEPEQRPSAEELLQDPIFRDTKKTKCASTISYPLYPYDKKESPMRTIYDQDLLKWLETVRKHYELHVDTWFLAVDLWDRYTHLENKKKTNKELSLQLCLLVASKLYDQEFTAKDVIDVMRRNREDYTIEQIQTLECKLVHDLGFHLFRPSANIRLGIYTQKEETEEKKVMECMIRYPSFLSVKRCF